jgi:hypothetical protein
VNLTEGELALYELAYNLRITVAELANNLSYEEVQGWVDFFRKRPPGWQEDYRAGAIIRGTCFGKVPDVTLIFPSLASLKQQSKVSPASSLKGSALLNFLQQATGGEKLPCLFET